ncbi:MAG: NAD-dependent epimerase/dehydratase family protein [Clostridia bacterium]|nr:NAD-dependent epimerase/dehydratase family protein [Clostridia bacterium]
MKKVLITGTGSYVGDSVCGYLSTMPDRYQVRTVGTIDDEWKTFDFSPYDTVYHVAGLAHSDTGRVSEERKAFYYKINTDLAAAVAKKAKAEGVKQFIFMSSAIVYGDSAPIGEQKVITEDTPCSPANFYGDSKVQAEKAISALADADFRVVILRCPMIYGKDSKGNFPTLEKMALKMRLFPKVKNERSMLYIGNLAEFVRLMIENEESGVFHPCNREYSNTSELVRMIAACRGKKTVLVPGFGWLLKILSHFTGYVNKAFGNLTYEAGLGEYKEDYRLFSLEESIAETEKR